MKYQPEDILTIDDVWLLLDYITNLQKESEKLNNIVINLKYKIFGKDEYIKMLEKRNEELNNVIIKTIKYLEEWHFDGYDPQLDIINELKEK